MFYFNKKRILTSPFGRGRYEVAGEGRPKSTENGCPSPYPLPKGEGVNA
jgi:hypothetical protein